MRTKEEYQNTLNEMKSEIDWNDMSYNRRVKMQNNINILQELIDNLKENE